MKKLIFYLLTISVVFPIVSTEIFANVKAVQISYLNCKNFKTFNKELIKIKKAGFNTVIFRVFNNKGDRIYKFAEPALNKEGVYFKTENAPVVADILGKAVKLCHQNGLKIVAWLTTRNLDFRNSLYLKQLKRVVRYSFKKNSLEKTKGLSFFSEKNINYMESVYKDLLKYNIDGILFQDDVKILIDEDFNERAISEFFKKTGIKLTPKNIKQLLFGNAPARDRIPQSENLEIWNNIKVSLIGNFIKRMVAFCKKNKKRLKFFMNVNYETLNRPDLSKIWYSYNIQSLRSTGVDYFMVMLYQVQMMKELHLSTKDTYNFIFKIVKNSSKIITNQKLVFKIQTYDWYGNRLISFNNINKLFTFFSKNNINNIAIFPYKRKLTLFKF